MAIIDLPLHPAIVHFTIGLFTISVAVDVAALFWHKTDWHAVAFYNLVFAGIAAIISVATGLTDKSRYAIPPPAKGTLETHQSLAFFISGIILTLLLWRIAQRGRLPAESRLLYLLIGLIGIALVVAGAFTGTELVYKFGVGITL